MTDWAAETRRIALAKALKPILLQSEADIATLHPRGTPLSHAPMFLADRLDAAGIGVVAHPFDVLRDAAKVVDALWSEPDPGTEDAAEGLIWLTDFEDDGIPPSLADALRALRAAIAR